MTDSGFVLLCRTRPLSPYLLKNHFEKEGRELCKIEILNRGWIHMAIKIFHTADLHIGMKFSNYPEPAKGMLRQARVDVLRGMVDVANRERCNLFVIAGDLFHNTTGIRKSDINSVVSILESFQGECVAVLPGNHDFDNEMVQLWKSFKALELEKIVFVAEERPYPLDEFDLNAVVYPAPCHFKHSGKNNIGWIKSAAMDDGKVNIAIAHGSIEGVSPDFEGEYFPMEQGELEALPVEVCLLGHTHVKYPVGRGKTGGKVFNPGTPEPDGLDCRHEGNAWIISVDDEKKVSADPVETGIFRFVDKTVEIRESEDYENIERDLLGGKSEKTIARLKLAGRVDEDVLKERLSVYERLEEALVCLMTDDSDLGAKITRETISGEFSEGSFPQKFLSLLADDEEALRMAYELVLEVKK